jgi:phosphate transport system substrate-binding protein
VPKTRLLALAATAAIAAVPATASALRAADPPIATAAKASITMSGSTSIYPLAVALAKKYNSDFPSAASFNILQGGSDIGIADVSKGRVSIGNSSRDAQASDPGGLVFNKIARDGICVITSPSNSLSNLSQSQVQDIFSGRVRTWDDVKGAKVTGPISLVARTPASGTQDAFQNIFMGPDLKVAGSASTKGSNGLVQQAVHSNKQAIGYVSFDFISGTTAVPYKGVACTLRNAKSGQYGGVRNFWMVTRGPATGAVAKFINWVKKSSAAQAIVGSHWVPLSS